MNRKISIVILVFIGGLFLHLTLISWTNKAPLTNAEEIKACVAKSFNLLQHSGSVFIRKVKCAGCHHSTLTSMLAEKLAAKGVTGIDTTAGLRVMAMNGTTTFVCNPNLVNQFVPARFLAPYVLLGLGAEKIPANISTDIAVDFIMTQSLPDGSFKAEYSRVPLESGDIHLAAFCIKAIQLYAPPARAAEVKQIVMRTRNWLEKQHPTDQQELSFQLLGMHWSGSDEAAKTGVAQKLYALQNKDGGWSQLPTMASDGYATGQVLYALSESGVNGAKQEGYQKGIDYLLKTQDASGAWIVRTRSNPIQPFVNSDFPPYDDDQYISAAATNWAALALTNALPDKK